MLVIISKIGRLGGFALYSVSMEQFFVSGLWFCLVR